MVSPSVGAFLAFFISVTILLYVRHRLTSSKNFPPGPTPIPFLGNLHQIPFSKSYLQFTDWSRTYGPLLGLHLGPSQKAIVINDWRTVRNLLDNRGVNYSSRPYLPADDIIVPDGAHVAFQPYTARWRKTRKNIMSFVKDSELARILPIQQAESTQMIWEVLNDPARYNDHFMRQSGAVILAWMYGVRGKTEDTKAFFDAQEDWAKALDVSAAPPYDIFPTLKYVPDWLGPWRGWRSLAESVRKTRNAQYKELMERAEKKIREGKAQDCGVAQVLKIREKEGFTDNDLYWLLGVMIEAGADTTAVSFLIFVYAMAAHPELLKRAQEEVDRVFGDDKMPETVNADTAPYLNACFWETLRWRPVLPVGIPHATSNDDVYNGYLIPAGTTVLMNIWALNHDPEQYPDPEAYSPDRYLSKEHAASASATGSETEGQRQVYTFGAGRRICPGSRMAEASMMLTMAKIVWAFDIKPLEGDTMDLDVRRAWKEGILAGPKEIGLRFEVRGEKRKAVIEREWRAADDFLKKFE